MSAIEKRIKIAYKSLNNMNKKNLKEYLQNKTSTKLFMIKQTVIRGAG